MTLGTFGILRILESTARYMDLFQVRMTAADSAVVLLKLDVQWD